MSVINKMLKDLEQRQDRIDSEMVPLVANTKPRNRGAKPLLLVLCLALWAAAGAYWWQQQKSSSDVAPQDSSSTTGISSEVSLLANANAVPFTDDISAAAASTVPSKTNTKQETKTPTNSAVLLASPSSNTPETVADTKAELQLNQAPDTLASTATNVDTQEQHKEPKPSGSTTDNNASSTQTYSSASKEAEIVPQAIVVPALKDSSPKQTATKNEVVRKAEPEPVLTSETSASKRSTPAKKVEITKPTAKEIAASSSAQLEIKALDLTPSQSADLHTRRAIAAKDKNNLESARREYAKALQFDPTRHQVREQLAALYYGASQNAEAISLLQEGLERYPNEAGLRLMLARIYTQNKDTSSAYQLLRTQQPEVSANIDYYAMLAGLAQQAKDYQQSRASYKQLIAVDPLRSRWWMGLGIAEDQLANYPQALVDYKRAVELGQLSSSSLAYLESRIQQLEQ
ncbi:hypothetical protein DBZ36_01620 [Alginatibacterium sediminis]|uniref:Uncharacterized protein n=1 Tax=Alginatibacterium sediminis TaxID=2164068 RepID=A0A420EL02_9ALTE|nr:tetratricopeptide repeat protein [Alginatibacterium sediminis]RKF21377.1 hypothetical protein DBZ36_01620 [Alginatibacterium sediminis]